MDHHKHLDAGKVKELAASRGEWSSILASLAPSMSDVVFAKKGVHVDCPFHGGKNDIRRAEGSKFGSSFNINGTTVCTCGIRDGYASLMEINGWSFLEATDAVGQHLGMSIDDNPDVLQRHMAKAKLKFEASERDRAKRDLQKDLWISKTLNDIHSTCISIQAPGAVLGRDYFRITRRLNPDLLDGRFIRFQPCLKIYKGKEHVDTVPAIISTIFSADGTPLTVHQTRLTKDARKHPVWGKWIFPVKSSHSELPGRLIPAIKPLSTTLGISEGIETGLAGAEGFGIQVWPLVAERNVRSFQPPSWCETLIGLEDKDRSGTGTAALNDLEERLLKDKWPGKLIRCIPDQEIPDAAKGLDWADVMYEYGKAGFPELNRD